MASIRSHRWPLGQCLLALLLATLPLACAAALAANERTTPAAAAPAGTQAAQPAAAASTSTLQHPGVFSVPMRRSDGGSRKANERAATGNRHYQRLLQAQSYAAQLKADRQQAKHTMAAPAGVGVTPLSGCPFADFTVPVMIGRGQTFDLIVDTGSATTAVAGSMCTTCTGVTPRWQQTSEARDQSGSSLGQYGDGSGWAGRIWQDRVAFGNGAGANATRFGRANVVVITQQSINGRDQSGNNRATARPFFTLNPCVDVPEPEKRIFSQGILGIAYPAIAYAGTESVLFKLFEANPQVPQIVSIQMCEATGKMWFGGADPAYYIGEPLYTPITEERYYQIDPWDMSVGGVPLNITDAMWGGASYKHIVDSGTTLWELPTVVYRAVVAQLLADPVFSRHFRSNATDNFFDHAPGVCEYPDKSGQLATWQTLQRELPTITLKMKNGLELTMDGVGSYLMPCSDQFDQWTPGISPHESGGIIGGWPLMNQFITIHDIPNRRIGFAKSTGCDTGRDPLRANVTMQAAFPAPPPPPAGSTGQGNGLDDGSATVHSPAGVLAALVAVAGMLARHW